MNLWFEWASNVGDCSSQGWAGVPLGVQVDVLESAVR